MGRSRLDLQGRLWRTAGGSTARVAWACSRRVAVAAAAAIEPRVNGAAIGSSNARSAVPNSAITLCWQLCSLRCVDSCAAEGEVAEESSATRAERATATPTRTRQDLACKCPKQVWHFAFRFHAAHHATQAARVTVAAVDTSWRRRLPATAEMQLHQTDLYDHSDRLTSLRHSSASIPMSNLSNSVGEGGGGERALCRCGAVLQRHPAPFRAPHTPHSARGAARSGGVPAQSWR